MTWGGVSCGIVPIGGRYTMRMNSGRRSGNAFRDVTFRGRHSQRTPLSTSASKPSLTKI